MRFILSEYITLLKEDGELDTLITDLLVGMKITPISIPQRGRQHGVDIAAVGIDPDDGKKKMFLFVVKQKNLTRSNWDSGVNSVRQSLNEVIDVYIRTMLDKRYKKLPIKIIVATNGEIMQSVLINWKNYVDEHTKKKRSYEFWGTGELAGKLDKYLSNEKLFPAEYQSYLRKTLAFLDLPDYNYTHFYQLIEEILNKPEKQKQKILKRLRLVRLCTGIIFKWSEDINNLRPALIASERSLLLAWDWISKHKHTEKNYVKAEFYTLFQLKRKIGVLYFNKTVNHYQSQHSLYRYGRNRIEYSLNTWEELGLISIIGLGEIQEWNFYAQLNNKENVDIYSKSAKNISNALVSFIFNNPPLNYPAYDEHSIEISLALQLLCQTGNSKWALKWMNNITVGFYNSYKTHKFFPLFRTNFDKLVDIHNGDDISEVDSTMILPIIVEYALLLNDDQLYQDVRTLVNKTFPKVNLQLWFATEDTEECFCRTNYSAQKGKLKHSITLYENMEDYEKEIIEEIDLFIKEVTFEVYKTGFNFLLHLASRHFRAQPFPAFWRLPIKRSYELKETK